MFCPKCGSLLAPKKEGSKVVVCCTSCKYKAKDFKEEKQVDKRKEEQKVEVVSDDDETLPIEKAECPECGNDEAYFWMLQTRASDEPETRFYKCTKCKKIWREYS